MKAKILRNSNKGDVYVRTKENVKQGEGTVLVAVIYMNMECRHIKRQDFLILNLLYIMPKKRLDFQILQA